MSLGYADLNQFVENGIVVNESGLPVANANFRRTTTISNVNDRLKDVGCKVEIRDRVTLAFVGESESVRTLIAKYDYPEKK
jgi:hypothetical protein